MIELQAVDWVHAIAQGGLIDTFRRVALSGALQS